MTLPKNAVRGAHDFLRGNSIGTDSDECVSSKDYRRVPISAAIASIEQFSYPGNAISGCKCYVRWIAETAVIPGSNEKTVAIGDRGDEQHSLAAASANRRKSSRRPMIQRIATNELGKQKR